MKNFILTLIFLTAASVIKAQIQPDLSDLVINSTIKIETIEEKIVEGRKKLYNSSGTGFFFEYKINHSSIPVVVTNKHVIQDAKHGILYFKTTDTSGLPNYTKIQKINLGQFKERWIFHPDTSVDLAIMPLAPILHEFQNKGIHLFYIAYTEEKIPNDSIKKTLLAIEDIFMIGYPFGLRDTKMDLPIVRKGLTATPAYWDFNSVKEFLIDIPVYPGSSGSPVIIYNPVIYTTRYKFSGGDSRLILLGINYATYTRDFQGKIVPKTSYNVNDSLKVSTAMPYNIGIIIKAERLLDFKPIVQKLVNR